MQTSKLKSLGAAAALTAKSSDGFVDVVRCAICTETTFESPFCRWKAAVKGW